MDKKPTVVSLFSGAGGFDWGFHKAGFQTILACEKLKSPASTLALNLNLKMIEDIDNFSYQGEPSVLNGDIKTIDFSRINISPDVLIGGPPCQDFSMAKGQERQGLNGGRGKLYVQYVRALMYFQPMFFVFENVPGLKSANDGTAYSTILSDLENLEQKRLEIISQNNLIKVPITSVEGYDILFSDIVIATKLGVPQTRKRLIILGVRKDLSRAKGPEYLESLKKELNNKIFGSNNLFEKYPLTCIEILEGKTLKKLKNRYRKIMRDYQNLFRSPDNSIAIEKKTKKWDRLTMDIIKDYFLVNGLDFEKDFSRNEFNKAMREHEALLSDLGILNRPISKTKFSDKTNTLPRQSRNVTARMFNIPPDENYSFVDGTQWQVEGKNISFIYRRSAPLKPASTVLAYGGGGTYGYHYERSRGQLTLRERARIQTFSDDFIFSGKGVRAQIGEAVPPILGEKIALTIKWLRSIFDPEW
jgi:DNA (cytosine-5)-methyltransferase 1